MKKFLMLCLVMCLFGAVVQEACAGNIIWVRRSDTANLERQADQVWIDHLVGLGYNVTEGGFETLTDENLAVLNAADLIIMGRGSDSGAYDDGVTLGGNPIQEEIAWNTLVTAPLLSMTPYSTRTSRWNWLNTNATEGVDLDPHTLTALNPGHAAFAGITLDGNNQMNVTIPGVVRQIEFNPVIALAGNETVVALATNGQIMIAEWAAGTAFVDGSIAGGQRMQLNLSIDLNAGTLTHFMDGLTPDSIQMFDNIVAYMIVPEPATLGILGLGALLIRRRK